MYVAFNPFYFLHCCDNSTGFVCNSRVNITPNDKQKEVPLSALKMPSELEKLRKQHPEERFAASFVTASPQKSLWGFYCSLWCRWSWKDNTVICAQPDELCGRYWW
jgi:hypothetical protein